MDDVVNETIRVGPARIVVQTDRVGGGRFRDHYDAFRDDDGPAPDLVVALRAAPGGKRPSFTAGRGEVALTIESGALPVVTAWPRPTPRAVLRAFKWFHDLGTWHESRHRLLLRFAFEHTLMTLLDSRYGFATFHASAVARDSNAIVILGPNGSGKSTAARTLVTENGCRLLADNFVPLDGEYAVAFPGRPRWKLEGGRAREETFFEPTPGAARIRGTILLNDGGATEKLSARAARRALEDYTARERENHLDTRLFAELGPLIERDDARVDRGGDAAGRLARHPVVTMDWRVGSVAEVAEDLLT